MNQILSTKEYYCFDVPINKPWNRRYLNWDFLETEKKRIEKAKEWYMHYLKAKEGENLFEINFYVKDINLSPEWKAYIYSIDDFEFKALSTLHNDNQLTFVMLVDKSNLPKDNSYILIEKSKKYIMINKRKETFNALIVEKWRYDETDKIYVDMPYERNIVSKLLKRTFQSELITDSLQSPLISCPKIINSVGG